MQKVARRNKGGKSSTTIINSSQVSSLDRQCVVLVTFYSDGFSNQPTEFILSYSSHVSKSKHSRLCSIL